MSVGASGQFVTECLRRNVSRWTYAARTRAVQP